MRERWRRLGIMPAALALMAVALAPAGSAAAPASITFEHTLGTRCVAGAKPATGTITLRLLAPSGATRATRTSPSASASLGGYEVCFKVTPRIGDRFQAVRGSVRRTVRVPTLTISVDRVTDVVSGKGPKGRTVRMLARHCTLPGDCDDQTGGSVSVNGRGRYREDLTESVDLRGRDAVIVRYENSAGDRFQVRAITPYLQAGTRDRVALYCASPGTHTVNLRRSDGTVRGSATFRSPQPCTDDHLATLPKRFRRKGTPIRPSAGNVIRSGIASDARIVWPGPTLQLPGGTVSGTCLRNAPYAVYLERVGEDGIYYTLAEGVTLGDGTFSVPSSMVFQPGDRARLICVTRAGDQVILDRTPPA